MSVRPCVNTQTNQQDRKSAEDIQDLLRSPDRIISSVNNTVTTRAGRAYNHTAQRAENAIEVSLSSEPYGNVITTLALDMEAAKSLRDQLNAILNA